MYMKLLIEGSSIWIKNQSKVDYVMNYLLRVRILLYILLWPVFGLYNNFFLTST